MPIYEYKCLSCKKHFEIMQRISDAPPKACSECGGEMEKQISLSGFQFKGGGWYVTDYSNKSASGDSKGIAESKETPSKTEASKSSDKPSSE
ncbi:MAG: FmdB family zinc ribbon protein [Acidobacteriota bacterium]